ncbi:His Kinase A (phospho-acceptor) domain-containing protein [Stigmatella aurantiaca]|uniref:histidine kinase n=1 Tax=Stigmatella aurantiaca TaxID=41 RepID=A0A1H7WQ29_STIAU|nr:GAF domain-containing protein [Stigmatella aurantiaca]SEM23650.1 His Kinase A (phospho-acceptor) domain-containing protein [Stigmatella aurantiaca]
MLLVRRKERPSVLQPGKKMSSTVRPQPWLSGWPAQGPASARVPASPVPGGARQQGEEPGVLLVDDHPANLVALEAILEPLGVRLTKAPSGEQALRLLLAQEFAVILLDVQMAGLNGYETAALIKQRERTRNIPIIFLTAHGQDETEVLAGYAQGAVDYLRKPLSPEVLRSKVSVFIELFRAQSQVRRQAELLRHQEAQAREAATRSADYIARLQTLTSLLAEATSVAQVVQALFEHGLVTMESNATSLCLLDPSRQELELVETVGYAPEARTALERIPLSSSQPLTEAVREGRPQWLSSRAEGLARYPSLAGSLRFPSLAALPLIVKGQAIGVLGLGFPQERTFSEDDRAFLNAVAHISAQAIDRARLYDEERLAHERVRNAAARLKVLAEATDAFSAANRDLPALFDAVSHQVVRHMGDSSVLHLLSEDGQRMELVSVRHVEPGHQAFLLRLLEEHPARLGEGLLGEVAQTGRSVLIPTVSPVELGARLQPEYRVSLERIPLQTCLVVPLWAQGRIIGTLATARSAPGLAFTPEELRLMEELAGKAAMSIENARLFQQQLRSQEELRRRTEFEQQLIGIVSHDLRNPLGAISMAAGMLLAHPGLDERQRRAAQRIASSGERATRLIRDLLDFTQARLGTGIPLNRHPMDLHEVTRHVVDEVLLAHPGRHVHVESSGEGWGEWDSDRIAQVLTNLLGNALAYSPAHTPVRVSTFGEADGARLEVHNQGAPIPTELLPRLFEPLTRGLPGEAQPNRSIGLGLYIVRAILGGHGGSIEVASSEQGGTTFTVRLPRRAST